MVPVWIEVESSVKSKVADYDGGHDGTEFPDLSNGLSHACLSLDEEDGGLGTVVNATGKGYKNGTSLIVFVDKPSPLGGR